MNRTIVVLITAFACGCSDRHESPSTVTNKPDNSISSPSSPTNAVAEASHAGVETPDCFKNVSFMDLADLYLAKWKIPKNDRKLKAMSVTRDGDITTALLPYEFNQYGESTMDIEMVVGKDKKMISTRKIHPAKPHK
jgi:hypothetical protein